MNIKIWGALKQGCQNFELINHYSLFSEYVDIKNKLNLTKTEAFKMRGPPKRGPPKFKLFNLLSRTHEIFKVSKRKDKIWNNLGIPK